MADETLVGISDDEARRGLEQERSRLEALRATVAAEAGEEVSGQESELSSVDQHSADSGTELENRTETLAVLEQVTSEIAEVEAALTRLRQGIYGRCTVCGEPIDRERLAALPATATCLRDRQQLEQGLAAPPSAGLTSASPI